MPDGVHCVCFGWTREYGVGLSGETHHRTCNLFSRQLKGAEVHLTGRELLVLGEPDEGDESHNCDAMGCGTFSHVLHREPLPVHLLAMVPGSVAPCGVQDGCEFCRSPLFAGRKCKNCGRVTEGVAGCPESGKHCRVIDGECQTCGHVIGVAASGRETKPPKAAYGPGQAGNT
jgi:hypothetical protein